MIDYKKLSDVCTISKGKKVKITDNPSKNSIPYLLIDTLRGTPAEFFTNDTKYLEAIESDILIVMDGANSGLVGTGVKGAVGSTIARLRTKENINSDYLTYFLEYNFSNLNMNTKGSAIPHVKSKYLLNLEIRLPDLEEQSLIVETIERELTRLENAVNSLKNLKEKLKVYRQSVLKALLMKDWQKDKIANLFKTTSGGTPSRSNKSYYSGNISWLKSGELNDNMQIEDSEEHINNNAINNSSAKLFPEKTVLIAMYGATTGKLGILKKESTTNQAVCGILPNEKYISEFIFYYLLYKRELLLKERKGGAQPNISQGVIKNINFPVIDINVQEQIVSEIESRFSVIDKVETIVESALLKSEQLKMSILKNAFEGKLVRSVEL